MAQNNKFTTRFARYATNVKCYIDNFASSDDIVSSDNIDGIIQEQASLWIIKLKNDLSSQEKLAFQQWAKQSDYHRNALFSLAVIYDNLLVINKLSALFPLEKPSHKKSNLMTKYVIAASVAVTLFFADSIFFSITPFPDVTHEQQFVEVKTLQTAVGQQTQFSLSDGSRVKLNTNSLINVSFSKNNRILTLIKGEANFNVAKDKSRPFTVTVGEKSFTALGTIFNIQKTTDKDIELVVTEGRVLITKSNQPLNKVVASTLTITPNETLTGLLIRAGEIATVENNIHTAKQAATFEQIQRKLAWQQGMLVFNGESLDQALAEISRYTTTKFDLEGSELSKMKVAGYFKANDIDGLLKSLSSNFNIQFKKVNNNLIRLHVEN